VPISQSVQLDAAAEDCCVPARQFLQAVEPFKA